MMSTAKMMRTALAGCEECFEEGFAVCLTVGFVDFAVVSLVVLMTPVGFAVGGFVGLPVVEWLVGLAVESVGFAVEGFVVLAVVGWLVGLAVGFVGFIVTGFFLVVIIGPTVGLVKLHPILGKSITILESFGIGRDMWMLDVTRMFVLLMPVKSLVTYPVTFLTSFCLKSCSIEAKLSVLLNDK